MNTESYSFSEILEIIGLSAPELLSLIERRKAAYGCKFFRDEHGKWHIGEEEYSHMDGFTDICEWLRGNGIPASEQYVDGDYLSSISDANSYYGVNFTRLDGSSIPDDGILDSKTIQRYKARLNELENLLEGSEDMDYENCAEVQELREEQAVADKKNPLTESFQFRDLRAKSASDDRLESATARLGHSDPRLTEHIYRRKPTLVRPLR